MSDPQQRVHSDPANCDQYVTKAEFSRLEIDLRTKFEEVLGLLKNQISNNQQSSKGHTYDEVIIGEDDVHTYHQIEGQSETDQPVRPAQSPSGGSRVQVSPDKKTRPSDSSASIYVQPDGILVHQSQSSPAGPTLVVGEEAATKPVYSNVLLSNVTDEVQRPGDNQLSEINKNLEQLQKDIKIMKLSIAQLHDTVKSSSKKSVDEIKKTVESSGEKMQEKTQKSLKEQLQNTQNHIDMKMSENTELMKEDMSKLKQDIVAFSEKDGELIRERIEGPLPLHNTYVLDLYVKDFKTLIKSGLERYSQLCHINQFKSSVQGKVCFLKTGDLKVLMLYGRHPREVGLTPRHFGKVKVKATIKDSEGQLPDLDVGENTWDFDEEEIMDNKDCGLDVGVVDGQFIGDSGYGAGLVRYLINML